MYTRPDFIRTRIEPTTAAVQYPAPGTVENPALPLIVYPEFIGPNQPHSGPKQIALRPFVDGGLPVPAGALATLYEVDRDGALRHCSTLFNGGFVISLPGAYVIQTHDELPTPVGWDVVGYSSSANEAS